MVGGGGGPGGGGGGGGGGLSEQQPQQSLGPSEPSASIHVSFPLCLEAESRPGKRSSSCRPQLRLGARHIQDEITLCPFECRIRM